MRLGRLVQLAPESAMATSMENSPLSSTSIWDTLGVTFLAVCVSSMLYGVTCLQTFYYYRSARAKTDGRMLYVLVAALFGLDSAHQIVVIHVVYTYLVLGFADPSKVTMIIWSLPTEIILSAILAVVLNGFLTFRVWKLSRRVDFTAISILLSLANFAAILSFAIRGSRYTDIFAAEIDLRSHGTTAFFLSVVVEVMISSTLVYYVYSRRTGLQRSNDIITKLIVLTVTTGMLTALCHVAEAVSYVAAPDQFYVLFFNFVVGKLYANCLLSSLNSREFVLGPDESSRPSDHETLKLAVSSGGSRHGRRAHPGIQIAVDHLVITDPETQLATKTDSVL
ncbi:hypothetical protein GY45DRAFT_1034296 [Cubamyces sp. BRFM 1775]|nr:hypothetical protein GY45DRAFT_1034296 [Cubamyces sp. BRFM 1775]